MPAARDRSALEEPGKLASVKIEVAGSVESIPKLTVGTSVWFFDQKLICVKLPPKLRLWEPRVQLTVSVNCQTGALRRLGAVTAVALVMPAAARLRLNPC